MIDKKMLDIIKKYVTVDFEDDDELLELFYDSVIMEMKDCIADFDEENMNARQKTLMLSMVKQLYDSRETYAKNQQTLPYTIRSMMLKEML